MMASPLQPPAPTARDNQLSWTQLNVASFALAASALEAPGLKCIICNDMHSAYELQRNLGYFCDDKTQVLLFPDWEILPYDRFSPHEDIISERLRILAQLATLSSGILIASINTLMAHLPPPEYIASQSWQLSLGDNLRLQSLRDQCIKAGYHLSQQVLAHGEFALRGSIVDVFPMGAASPFRIELFDDTIDSLRTFNVGTQCTEEEVAQITLLPAHEYPLTEDAITLFRQQWRERFQGNPKECSLYNAISQARSAAGIEFYLPLFFKECASIFDFLPQNTTCLYQQSIVETAENFIQETKARYQQLAHDITRPILPAEAIYLTVDSFFQQLKNHRKICWRADNFIGKSNTVNFFCESLPAIEVAQKGADAWSKLEEFCQEFSGKIMIHAESPGRMEIILELLAGINLKPHFVANWQAALTSPESLIITVSALSHGFIIADTSMAIITEAELFGNQVVQQRRLRQAQQQDPRAIIKNLTELKLDDPVIHLLHGIGLYRGLSTITTGEITAEYLALEYANQDKIYVPITDLHCISRYNSADHDSVSLHRLGSNQWQKAREKAQRKVHDVAAELLDLHSKRALTPGFAFNPPDQDFLQFRSAFAFEETPDQSQSIEAIITDMTQEKAMDRLVCGDVGFGKTEVAMQACFIAVASAKQVAILVPTTLLAQQHYQNFMERFANWPIKIGLLSRLQGTAVQKETLTQLAAGKVDIVIGTHKLLQPSVNFKDLGLLIVDEEHRFGVRHKERIKQLRAHIDILTLTATPIPRSLNMALSSTRDLSLITTPPLKRLSVKTFIYVNNKPIIQEAISRELLRGGQAYFLHNSIDTLVAKRNELLALCPGISIAIAHGQMRQGELEQIMADFYHQKYQVLLCTTIIESGIDVPTANTIIIDRADRFGLAQLHQIRGRVGRSHHQAYAYLLTPEPQAMTGDAQKRLEAFSALSDLGAGFNLAMQDLEIRGAGEFLGAEQSGHIHALGFSLYMQMLEEAVEALRDNKPIKDLTDIKPPFEVDTYVSTLFPKDYIGDVSIRLSLYKRLASCRTQDALDDLKIELIDRFGRLPQEAHHLLLCSTMRLLAEPLGITKVDIKKNFCTLYFCEEPNIDINKVIKLIQNSPHQYQLNNTNQLKFLYQSLDFSEQVTLSAELMSKIQA